MSTSLRLALAQINTTAGDIEGNLARIRDGITTARDAGADLVVFPEMTVTGYPAEDLWFRRSFIDAARVAVAELLPDSRDIAVVVGYPHQPDPGGPLFNTAAVLHGGNVVAVHHKQRLPNYGVFDEARYFTEGDTLPVIRMRGIRVGLTICEDIWVPGGPGERERELGRTDLIINLSASPYHLDKPAERDRIFGRRARELGCHLAVCNLVGGQDELVFDGNSIVLGPLGDIMGRARGFEEDVLVVDIEGAPDDRDIAPPGSPITFVDLDGDSGERSPAERPPLPGREPPPSMDPRGERYRALTLGTGDYVRKNGFERVVIGLSGGIDSALTATIAADALGPDAVVGVTMPSAFSSTGSVEDSRELARRLGIELMEISIGETYDAFMAALAPAFAGTSFGIAEENLQARIRGTLLMSLSNKFGWLVLTTGNKSEVAVGYSTLYGDTAGGFAVIKDVYKTEVYALARHRNARGEVIPVSTLDKPPSAELRPDQQDTDSLPPYDVLDAVLEAYVERDRPLADLVADGFDEQMVRNILRMVDRAEYKRRQNPPGVKITPRAFGKDRRLPITSGWIEGSRTDTPS